jgi:diamine N-acetyltransferase
VNTEEDLQLYMSEAFHPEKIKKDLADAGNTFLLEYYNNELIGYVKLRTDRTYDEFKNESAIEIERIYVKHQYHGMKAGKALMDMSIDIAKKGNYAWLWLGVNDENNKAIDFYKKYGFTIFGTKTFKLGTAVDEDYLMKLKL